MEGRCVWAIPTRACRLIKHHTRVTPRNSHSYLPMSRLKKVILAFFHSFLVSGDLTNSTMYAILFVTFSLLFSLLPQQSVGHSWPESIAGGAWRGAQAADDLGKQRYYCPLSTLAACQPAAKNNVVLDASAMRPCRSSPPITTPMGSAVAGGPMYIHWAGNGHTSPAQNTGTCVKIGIAPYAVDPDASAFRILAACLPYSRGPTNDLTDGTVTVPADLAPGRYTVWWEWDFAPFWFSDCGDINVSAGGGGVKGATPVPTGSTVAPPVKTNPPATIAPTPHDHGMPTTTAAPATISGGGSSSDCKSFTRPNTHCQTLYGAQSFCMSWQVDKCGRSLCAGQPPMDTSNCAGKFPTNLLVIH